MCLGQRIGWAVCLLGAGCATTPPLDNPLLVRPGPAGIENPVLVSPGVPTPKPIARSSRRPSISSTTISISYRPIPTMAALSPGRGSRPVRAILEAGQSRWRGRLLATFQTIRQTATAEIRAGERGGYLVYVVVDRELEDLSRPTQARIGNAIFQDAPTVDRQLEVVGGETSADHAWFKVGRDYALEQQILERIRNCR